MAGIPNQPTGKPGSVPSPVPNEVPADSFEAFQASQATTAPSFDQFAAQSAEPAPEPEQTMGQQAASVAADWAPAAGGLLGGIAGAPLGPAGAITGAAVGGALGSQIREFLETTVLGKPALDQQQSLNATGRAAIEEGAGQAVGGVIGKAAGAALKGAGTIAKAPIDYVRKSIQSATDKITEPVLKLLANKTTDLTSEASGNAVKSLLKENIKGKYGPFIQAYGDLDAVAKTVPLDGAVRQGFTNELRKWGSENLAGDSLRTVKKFAGALDTASSGRQFESVLGQITDARQVALQSGATKQAAVLKELQNKAEDFMELETTKLAARIQGGKATPQELGFLNQVVQSRGIQEPDPTKYAKSLAKDYLSAKDKIKKDYAGFRSFLEDVGEQTKVKTSKRGPMRFLDEIDDVPSEKLVERMFDPKNAAALRRMKAETPEVFDQVTKAKVNQILQRASPDGKLDLKAFRSEVHKIPDATRLLLFGPQDMKLITSTLDNPKLPRLQSLQNTAEKFVGRWADDLAEVADVVKPTSRVSAAAKQVVGRPAVAVGQKFLDAFQPPPPESQ